MPAFIVVFFSFEFGTEYKYKVGIVDKDKSYASNEIIKSIDNLEDIETTKVKEKDYDILLITQQIEVAVIIDKGFEANLLNFKEKSILKQFKDYKFDNDNQTENDRKEFVSTVSGIYMNISEIGNKIVTNGIKKVELPDGSFVDDKNLIYEFVSNSSASFVSEIHTKIKELNDIGLPKELEYICPYCNYKWKDVFYGFNQSDFFGLSS